MERNALEKWFMRHMTWVLEVSQDFREQVAKEGFKGLDDYSDEELLTEYKLHTEGDK